MSSFLFKVAIILLSLSMGIRSDSIAVKSLNSFSNLFYKGVNNVYQKKNTVMSPFSTSISLALLAMGAEGKTLEELQDGLFAADKVDIKNKYDYLLKNLASLKTVNLNFANKLYEMHENTITMDFDTQTKDFQTDVEAIDFTAKEEAADKINNWLKSKTNNSLNNVAKADMFNADTKLVMANALGFNCEWLLKFKAKDTKLTDGFGKDKKKVEMMSQVGEFAYGSIPLFNAKAVEIPYKGEELFMVIILPDKNEGLSLIQQKLDSSTNWNRLLYGLKKTEIKLSIPKFKVSTELDLKEILPEMGVDLIFDLEKSELNLILENYEEYLPLSNFFHGASIEINEEGTNIGPTTTKKKNLRSNLSSKVSFIADRQFMFMIMDKYRHIYYTGNYVG